MEVERVNLHKGQRRFIIYRVSSEYAKDSLAFEPGELMSLLRWLQEHEDEITQDVTANVVQHELKGMEHMATQEEAARDWYTRALVRVKEPTTKRSVDPYREYTFRVGEELEMVQWGRDGRPVKREAWWTSFDIDGALIIEADKVEVVKILDEITPFESEAERYNREIDERNRISAENIDKPWLPIHDGE